MSNSWGDGLWLRQGGQSTQADWMIMLPLKAIRYLERNQLRAVSSGLFLRSLKSYASKPVSLCTDRNTRLRSMTFPRSHSPAKTKIQEGKLGNTAIVTAYLQKGPYILDAKTRTSDGPQ